MISRSRAGGTEAVGAVLRGVLTSSSVGPLYTSALEHDAVISLVEESERENAEHKALMMQWLDSEDQANEFDERMRALGPPPAFSVSAGWPVTNNGRIDLEFLRIVVNGQIESSARRMHQNLSSPSCSSTTRRA